MKNILALQKLAPKSPMNSGGGGKPPPPPSPSNLSLLTSCANSTVSLLGCHD